MNVPNPPRQTGLLENWLKRLQEAVQANQLITGRGYKLKRSMAGTVLEIESGGGGGISVKLHRFKSMMDNHIVCRTFDGFVDGAEDVLIAKPPKLRYSIVLETIGTMTVQYLNYSRSNQERRAIGASLQEFQVITPRYLVNDLIFAIPASTQVSYQSTTTLPLLDMNVDARAWMAIQ